MADSKKQIGVVGLYDAPESLLRAAEKVRDAGYRHWDCHSPYPVHGLDQAMGLRDSPIPTIGLTAGFLGVAVALWMQGWMSAIDYPVRIGGKPLFSWPAFVPITFELFVLFAAVTTMVSLLLFGRLGRWHSPLHDSDVMAEITSHRFAVVLEGSGENDSSERAAALLASTGCRDIRPLYEEADDGRIL